jgi:hypothetical protein
MLNRFIIAGHLENTAFQRSMSGGGRRAMENY